MPDHVVLADVSVFSRPPGRGTKPRDLPGFDRFESGEYARCLEYEYRHALARIEDETYLVRVWLGPGASREDRQAMESVINSLRFAR